MENFDYDYLVLGAGSGGIASGNRAAIHGAKVAIIEANNIGGTCVNLGCVPKKVLWNGATILEMIKNYAPDYGINLDLKNFDYAKLVGARQAYISRIHTSYSYGFNNNKVTVIKGWGKLIDKHSIEVTNAQGEKQIYTGKKILLATGGKPSIPNIKGAEYGITSDGFFTLTELPKSVIIVGAGYIAVEIAGVLANFGVETTLVTRGSTPLRWADDDIITKLLEAYQQQNIKLVTNSSIKELIKNDNGSLTLVTNQDKLTAKCVIWAIGREPNTANIGLENTQVQIDDKGFVLTNELNETAEPSIYAIGDMTHMPALTPVAIAAGRSLSERLFNNQTCLHYNATLVPTVIFSHPAIGTVGINERDALAKFGAYSGDNPQGIKIYKSTFTSMISAVTSHRQACFMKLITQGTEEKVIGLHGIGYGVDEMIQGFAVAMNMGATKADFDNTVAIHPTGSEEFVTMR